MWLFDLGRWLIWAADLRVDGRQQAGGGGSPEIGGTRRRWRDGETEPLVHETSRDEDQKKEEDTRNSPKALEGR
jgi:hypothetical protein